MLKMIYIELKIIYMNKENIEKRDFSFEKGYYHVRVCDAKECRRRITEALGLKHRVSFLHRLRGKVEPTVSEAAKIESIFAEYGVTDVWGKVI
jgi:hypothetical protein